MLLFQQTVQRETAMLVNKSVGHEHITDLDVYEGFFSPEARGRNEEKGRQCALCGLVLSNQRIRTTGADVAAREKPSRL